MLIENTNEQIRSLSRETIRLDKEYSEFLRVLKDLLTEHTPIQAIVNEDKLVGFKGCGKTFVINKTLKKDKSKVFLEIKIHEKINFPETSFNEVFVFRIFTDYLTDIVNEEGQQLCASSPEVAIFIAENSVLKSIEPKD